MSGQVYKPLTFRRCFKRGWFFKLRLYSDSSAVRLLDLWFLGFSLTSWLKDFWEVFFPYCKAKLALTWGHSVDLKLRMAPRGWFKYMFIEWASLRVLQCHVLHPLHPLSCSWFSFPHITFLCRQWSFGLCSPIFQAKYFVVIWGSLDIYLESNIGVLYFLGSWYLIMVR